MPNRKFPMKPIINQHEDIKKASKLSQKIIRNVRKLSMGEMYHNSDFDFSLNTSTSNVRNIILETLDKSGIEVYTDLHENGKTKIYHFLAD